MASWCPFLAYDPKVVGLNPANNGAVLEWQSPRSLAAIVGIR